MSEIIDPYVPNPYDGGSRPVVPEVGSSAGPARPLAHCPQCGHPPPGHFACCPRTRPEPSSGQPPFVCEHGRLRWSCSDCAKAVTESLVDTLKRERDEAVDAAKRLGAEVRERRRRQLLHRCS